jgi:hypothetical protein
MNRPLRPLALLTVTAAAVLAAGCGAAASPPGAPPAAGALPSLATATATDAGMWAVAVMGGAAAQHNNFWQLFARPAGAASWRLVTPPGVASNGGLVIAPHGGRSLTAAFRPSQRLVFTPLAVTSDFGAGWSSAILDAPLANVPDALAAAPGSARLLALLTDGTVEVSGSGATWTPLVTRRTLAGSGAGARCGLQQLTAAAFSPAGAMLLAGGCAHPGTAGIFADSGGAWRPAGPALPAALAGQPVTVLRLTSTGSGLVAVLQAGTGQSASLLAAWSADGVGRWNLSAPFRLGAAAVAAASFGPAGETAVTLTGGRGLTIAGPGQAWRQLPALPAGTATLAPGPGAALEALAVHGSRLTVWRPGTGDTGWTQVQAITVPIQYGSSG